MYEKRKDEKIITLHFSYCERKKNHNEVRHAPISCYYKYDGGRSIAPTFHYTCYKSKKPRFLFITNEKKQ